LDEQYVCSQCGSYQVEEGYTVPLCKQCRERYIKYPIPWWIKIISLIIGGIVIFSLFNFSKSFKVAVAYERGIKAEKDRKYVTALKQYEKVVETFPDSTKALTKLFIAYAKNDYLEEASKVYRKIEGRKIYDEELLKQVNATTLELNRINNYSPELKGILETNKNNNDTLLKLQEYSKKKPSDSMAYLYMGYTLFDMGKYNEAKEGFLRAAELTPNSFNINLSLAGAYRQLGEYDKAIAECNKVLKDNVESIQAYCTLSKIELKRHNYKEALQLATKAYELNTNDIHAISNITIVYHFNKMNKECDAMFEVLKNRGYYDLDFIKGVIDGKINIYD